MNENTLEFIDADTGDVLADTALTAPVVEDAETLVGEVVDLDRPFMTTAFEDYSVTEGLLLLLVLLTFLQICIKLVKEGFWWL